MEQFVLIGMPDEGHRYIKGHPLLKLLPVKWARAMIPKTKVKLTEIIYDKDNRHQLGYILDVPGFFIDWDKHENSDRIRIINSLIGLLRAKGIRILVFPLWREVISMEEKEYLEEFITILDGGLIKLISLVDTVEKLLAILNVKPHEIEIGIWGADNAIGRVWTELLAPRVNYLAIGGQTKEILVELGNNIFHETGLSCHISTDPNLCLNNKSMAILCTIHKIREAPHNTCIIISSSGTSIASLSMGENNGSTLFIESGWFSLPQTMVPANNLGVWELMGITEAILFIRDRSYRDYLMEKSLTLDNLRVIKEIIEKSGIKFSGMISNGKILSYDGFRRLYFGKHLDKQNDAIL
jgi:hypothetical protein